MEYEVVIHNIFATFDIVGQLAGQASLFSFAQDDWLVHRSFVAGNFDPHLSPNALAQLRQLKRAPVHSTKDFTLYQISNRGSLTTDYYHLPDKRVLVYDRQIKFARWEVKPALTAYSDSEILDSPLGHAVINSPFGKIRGGKPHGGADYLAGRGTPYHATAKGTVVRADFSPTYGNVVILDHGPGYNGSAHVYTVYAHASKLLVNKGQPVKTGDVVSLVGNTGHVVPAPPLGNHGHYEVIQSSDVFGSLAFYSFKNKHKPADLRKLLRGH